MIAAIVALAMAGVLGIVSLAWRHRGGGTRPRPGDKGGGDAGWVGWADPGSAGDGGCAAGDGGGSCD